MKTCMAWCSLGAKCVELVLACTCLALMHTRSNYVEKLMVLYDIAELGAIQWGQITVLEYFTYVSYIAICPILIVFGCFTKRVPRIIDIICCTLGMALFLITGGVILYTYNQISNPEQMFIRIYPSIRDAIFGVISSRFRRDIVDDFKNILPSKMGGQENILATGVISVINGFVFFVDLLLVFRKSSPVKQRPTGHVLVSQG